MPCCVLDETTSRKFGQEMKREKRRVLGVINQNLVGRQEEEGCHKKKLDPLRSSVTRYISIYKKSESCNLYLHFVLI